MIMNQITMLASERKPKKNFIKMGFKKTKYLDCPSIWIKSSKKKPRIKNFIVYVDENLFSRDQFLFDKKMKNFKCKYFS